MTFGPAPAELMPGAKNAIETCLAVRPGEQVALIADAISKPVAASLRAALEEGTFRQDLYYRLNVVPINIPPLRERKEDIPFLAIHFVEKLAKELGSSVREISPAAMDRLIDHSWPGNVRELENTLERSMVLSTGPVLEATDIRIESPRSSGAQGSNQQPLLPEGMTLEQWEQMMIRESLRRAGGNKSQAARLLGLTRNALRYRLSQMGLDSGNNEEPAE